MKRTTLFATLGASFCVLTALSCSGGGGGGTGVTASTSVSSGAITGFGSVKLNGKEYDTQNSSFVVDGQSGSQTDLKVGMVVTVNGSLSSTGTRSASNITQEDVVEGVIQSIPLATNDRIVVLGQTVLIDNGTVFDNISPKNITGLTPGNLVEVNGFVIDKGVIIATLIEKKTTTPTCQVKGIVENHDSGAQTFTIGASNVSGGLNVSYNGGTDISDMPNPAVNAWKDLLVEVKGSPCTQASQHLVATKVEPEGINVANADEIEVEGAITLFNSSASFMVNGVPVVTNPNTNFEGGVAGDLAPGVEVEVEGSLTNGVLTAKKVSFRDNVEIEGNVIGVAPFITIAGLSPLNVDTNAQTIFKNGSSVALNNHIRVRGRPTGTNTVIAAEVEILTLTPGTQVILEGAVQSALNPNVTVLGVLIDTSPISDSNFKGSGVNSRAAFFATVKLGTLVKAQGDWNGSSVVWSEIEIEGEDD